MRVCISFACVWQSWQVVPAFAFSASSPCRPSALRCWVVTVAYEWGCALSYGSAARSSSNSIKWRASVRDMSHRGLSCGSPDAPRAASDETDFGFELRLTRVCAARMLALRSAWALRMRSPPTRLVQAGYFSCPATCYGTVFCRFHWAPQGAVLIRIRLQTPGWSSTAVIVGVGPRA